MKSAVIAALLGSATATYQNTAKCGACVEGGYVFCYAGTTEGEAIAATASYPTSYCCDTYDASRFTCG